MSAKLSFDQIIDNKHAARIRRDDADYARLERRTTEAERFVGELCRDGRPVYYLSTTGCRYFESKSHLEVVQRVIQLRLVR